jgi:predicted RNase H-like nuclease
MKSIGVDACKKGWVAVLLDPDNCWQVEIFNTFEDLYNAFDGKHLILIDIPIGLPQAGKRQCDVETRKILKNRAASVFPAPCRQAVQAQTYDGACRINQKILGVKLSVQTWNIAKKIREVDDLLCRNKKARPWVRESHPEVCFWSLAGEKSMTHYKKSDRGIAERLGLLKRINPVAENIFNFANKQFLRKNLAQDDVLDATVLAVTASAGMDALVTIPKNPPRDAMGLPMEIVYQGQLRSG